jgi:ATP-binding cassette subfamily B protein
MKNLNQFFKHRTVVIVAHRLSTARNADQIIALDKETIVDTGTHNELTNIKGVYHNLVKNLELGL